MVHKGIDRYIYKGRYPRGERCISIHLCGTRVYVYTSMKGTKVTANGEPGIVTETVEAYGETYLTIESRETGEEIGTVEQSEVA